MDRDFAEGLISGLDRLRAAHGNKAAVEAACRELEDCVGSVGALFGFLEQRRKKCKPTWAMKQIIWYIESESRRPGPHSMRAILGMLSGDQESAELSRFLEQAETTDRADLAGPLTWRARIIRDKLLSLAAGEAMTLPELQDWYETKADLPAGTPGSLDDGTWKRVRLELLPHGLKNRRNVGYYIEK